MPLAVFADELNRRVVFRDRRHLIYSRDVGSGVGHWWKGCGDHAGPHSRERVKAHSKGNAPCES
jgi:hypothetical protein